MPLELLASEWKEIIATEKGLASLSKVLFVIAHRVGVLFRILPVGAVPAFHAGILAGFLSFFEGADNSFVVKSQELGRDKHAPIHEGLAWAFLRIRVQRF